MSLVASASARRNRSQQQRNRASGQRERPVADSLLRLSLVEEDPAVDQAPDIPLHYSPPIPLTEMLPLMRLPHGRAPPNVMRHNVPFATQAEIVAAIDQSAD